jgi:hypothetical protein
MRILIRDLFDPGFRIEKFGPGIRNIGGERQAAAAHSLAVQYARTDTRKYSFSVRVVGFMESSTGHCEDSPYQRGIQERTKAQQIVKKRIMDNRFRGL